MANDTLFVLRSLGFSALAGMRSISPPALLSLYLGRNPAPENAAAQRVSSTSAQVMLAAMAAGEMLADKFPQAPNRTFAPALVGRAITGGGVCALLWSLHQRPAWLGALLGAGSAIAATYATFNLRLWLGRVLPLPGALSWTGLLEDALVWLGGWWLLHSDGSTKPIEQQTP